MTSLTRIIQIAPDERAVFIGMTGSGKSALALELLDQQHNVIVLDPKHDAKRPGSDLYKRVQAGQYRLVTTTAELAQAGQSAAYDRVIFLVPPTWEVEDYDRFFLWVYERENTRVYSDEGSAINDNANAYPKWQKRDYVQGRSKNIGMWLTNQDPVGIPRFTISQAEHKIVFYQSMPGYQRYLEELCEHPINWGHLAKNKHDFYYFRRGHAPQGPFRLSL